MGYRKEISLNNAKVVITFFGIFVSIFLPLTFLNEYFLHLPCWVPVSIVCIPVATMLLSLLIKLKLFAPKDIFTLKFIPIFPGIIYFNLKCSKSAISHDQVDQMREVLHPGDVILRRVKNYLDGQVLGQTSFFTHVGLYYGNWGNKKNQVMHAVSHWGVSFTHLSEFCQCEDIAILRFNTDPELMKKHLSRVNNTSIDFINDKKNKIADLNYIKLNSSRENKSASATEYGQTKNVRTFIEKNEESSAEVKALSNEELSVYDNLIENTKCKSVNYIPEAAKYIPLVLKQARLLKGTRYDYRFNFVDFKKLSCVEFVWYCYKCLFPLHQIRRKPFLYFGWVRQFVIIPDMFVASEFFSLKYSSVKNATVKSELKRYTRSHLTKFRTFVIKIIAWNITILLLIYMMRTIFKKA